MGRLNPTCETEIIIAPNAANKTLFLFIDFIDMVIRQLFVKKKSIKNLEGPLLRLLKRRHPEKLKDPPSPRSGQYIFSLN